MDKVPFTLNPALHVPMELPSKSSVSYKARLATEMITSMQFMFMKMEKGASKIQKQNSSRILFTNDCSFN